MTTQGQMLEHSERGKILIKIIKEIKPKNVVEIGTWKGLGSTKCIIESIDNGSNFISIESNYNFHNLAKNNLTNYLDKVNYEHLENYEKKYVPTDLNKDITLKIIYLLKKCIHKTIFFKNFINYQK